MAGFTTSARTVDMLGRQQIAGIPTAISELFKNAHDAYANTVEADFIRYKDVFIIRDDGDGMSREDFESRWLTLGTSAKSVPTATPRDPTRPQRAILGEKGIGRLAIATIGPQTLVVTKAKGHPRVVSLIHWGVFELAHANLSQIVVPVVELEPGQAIDVAEMGRQILRNVGELVTDDDEGLFDRIRRDISRWSQTDLKDVTRTAGADLESFESGTAFMILPTSPDLEADLEPPSPKEAPPLLRTLIGFANTMTPDHAPPELTTVFRDHRAPDDVRDLIEDQEFFTVDEFLKADHHFQGTFDEYGQFMGTVSIFGNDPVLYPLAWSPARGVKTQCGPFKLNLAYVQGNPRHTGIEADDYVLLIKKLDQYGGLYLYRDGIRVLPYGDSSFDWLDVERRRSTDLGAYFFSYRRMFGAVEITRAINGQLREKAGREGFATNEAYRQFREILRNFLKQVAADFFNETGPQSDAYLEGRLANERMDKARRARRKQVSVRRSEYRTKLGQCLRAIESGDPEKRVEEIQRNLQTAIEGAKRADDSGKATNLLVEAERKAHSELRELDSNLQVKRPRGVALSVELTKDSRLYEARHTEVLESVIEPAEHQIDTMLASIDLQLDRTVHRRKRFDESIEVAVKDARASTKNARSDLRDQTSRVNDKSKALYSEAFRTVEAEIQAVLTEKASTDISQLSDEEFAQRRTELEKRIEKTTSAQIEMVQSVADQLRSIVSPIDQADVDKVSVLDQIEQLEDQVEVLTTRQEDDFELMQVGLAINIVAHEFNNSVQSLRDNLKRLRVWAQQNPSLRPLYGDLRASFEHLDGYLKLLTPLRRRLYREPVEIRGSDLLRYMHDVFDQQLRGKSIELVATPAFEDMKVRMYPSTLYPVIVNLIDNALYWVDLSAEERKITLDKADGIISVTDSGRGVIPGEEEVVFERGFSRKPAGSGYGLYIAGEALRRDHAGIRLAPPSEGRGARFEILLPDGSEQ